MKFNGTVTLYNTVEVDFKKTLFPHLLSGVHVEKTRGAESAAEGDKNTDNLLVIIPFKPYKNGFLMPLEFEKCEDRSACWTLAAGDLIAVGDTGAADDLAELTARAETFRITSVKTCDFGSLQHWEVIAK
ncbi:MAG: hypothetical protein K2N38_08770 [Oscillospiraceae bacterium]|nr:hypothetical protein [Oscillospiraceae bacterium]